MKFGLRFVSALATGAALLGALPGGVVAQVNIVQPSIPVVIEPSAPNPPEAESRRREAVPATLKFKNDGLFIAYFHGLCQVGSTNTAFDSGNIIKGTVRETSDRFFVGDSVLVTISYANYLVPERKPSKNALLSAQYLST